MKNKLTLLFFLISISGLTYSQNLITNGSFETYTGSCPNGAPNGSFVQVVGWKHGMDSQAGTLTVDLYCGQQNYSECAPGPTPTVGSDSAAYIGLHTRIYFPSYNEDIYQELATPLVSGSTYLISFDLMTCQGGLFTNGPSDFCVYINADTIIPACPTENPSVVNVGCIPYDSISKTSWQNHSFQFTAPPNANVIAFSGAECNISEIYYYLDNVQLYLYKPNGREEIEYANEITLSPNPFSDQFSISSSSNKLLQASLYDLCGREILKREFTGAITLNTGELSGGIYFYEVRAGQEKIKTGKIIKH